MKESKNKSSTVEDDKEDDELVKINSFWYRYLDAETSDSVERSY